MPKFKNVTQLNADTCKMLLYGTIGSGPGDTVSAASFVSELDFAAQFYKNANIHISTDGGDTLQGIAILKGIQNSPMNIRLFVDSIAASMGFVIAECGKPVEMSKYARLMAHRVTGTVSGNASEIAALAKQAESIENDLIKIIADKTKLKEEDIKARWFDGQDHWIKAGEALAMGLINGIYDGIEIDIPEPPTNIKELINKFNNKLTENIMNWKNYFKKAGLRDEASEEEAIANLDKLNQTIADKDAELAKLKTDKAAIEKELNDKKVAEATAAETEIKTEVENAIKDGRIRASQNGPTVEILKTHYTNLLKANKEAGMAVLNSLPKAKRLAGELDPDGDQEPEERKKWKFADWQAKAGKDLTKMKAENFERYKGLYKAQFGKEPPK